VENLLTSASDLPKALPMMMAISAIPLPTMP
jgi:hypothetical protein